MEHGAKREQPQRLTSKVLVPAALGAMLFALGSFAEAQSRSKIPRIGLLYPESAPSPRVEEFRRGLADLGYIEGRNIAIEYRYAKGNRKQLSDMAMELAQLKVDVIVTLTTLAARPAKEATDAIPIVAVSGDPVGTGLVASLSRPGGNVTGLAFLSPDLVGKRLELLKEVIPRLTRVAVLWDEEGPAKRIEFKEAKLEAPKLGLQIQSLEIRAPAPDLESVFRSAKNERAEGLLTLGNPLTLKHAGRITDLAAKNRLPSMYDSIQFVEAGGLVSYGPEFSHLYRRAAYYVDRILKGAKPANLPVERPAKFEMFVNLNTAKQIGLTIPPNVLARADKVMK
jgi:putative ABC transport system substrate-binding protein